MGLKISLQGITAWGQQSPKWRTCDSQSGDAGFFKDKWDWCPGIQFETPLPGNWNWVLKSGP